MRALAVLLALDLKQAWRHRFVHVVVGAASVFGALIRFALPKSVERALPWPEPPASAALHHSVTLLGPLREPPPFDASFVPLMLGLDVVMLGFLFGGVMVLQEKMDGTVRAYRVGPGGSAPYLVSKLCVNALLALLNAAVLLAWAYPAALLEPALLALVLGVTVALTLLGMGLATFFESLSTFFYPLSVIGLVLNLPMLAYVSPSLGLDGLRWIPTWDVMFAGRAILFDPAGLRDPLGVALRVGLAALAAGAFAAWAIDRRLMREAG